MKDDDDLVLPTLAPTASKLLSDDPKLQAEGRAQAKANIRVIAYIIIAIPIILFVACVSIGVVTTVFKWFGINVN